MSTQPTNRPRTPCKHCGIEIIQLRNGNWTHLGRHHHENHTECPPLTVAIP